MNLIELFAKIQANPDNIYAYRRLIDYYKKCNQSEFAEAFEHLIKKKYGTYRTNPNEESTEPS